MTTAFVGRQPIYQSNLQTVAYEVLFRDSELNRAKIDDGNRATAELILNVFTEIGLENIVGSLPAFINVTREFILRGHAHALPQDRVVLEVLEDIAPSPEIISALKDLSSQGYKIALDDFVFNPVLEPFIEIADIVKVELPAIQRAELPKHVKSLRKFGVILLAEKVETHDEFEFCQELGFDLFQGYFFCRPNVISGKRLPVNRVAALRLVIKLRNPNVQPEELAELISTEPSLCYKVIRFVNSAVCGLPRQIDSVPTAITLVGVRKLQTFASLSMLVSAADDKPQQLILTSLTRARMCELVSEAMHRPESDMYFMMGLFSTLDAMLDRPMPEVLSALNLSSHIYDALTGCSGEFSDVLECVLEYEQGNWNSVHLPGMNEDAITTCYLKAVSWAAATLTALN